MSINKSQNRQPVPLTPEQDRIIIEGRAAGLSWSEIQRRVKRDRSSIMKRADKLGLARKYVPPVKESSSRSSCNPLPAGSRETWSLISNEEYPRYPSAFGAAA